MESVLVEDSLYRLDCAGHRVQTWDNGYDSRMLWTFWIFKQQPYFALEVVGRKRFLFFFDKTFAFPESKQTQFLLKPLYRVSRQIFFLNWQLCQDTLYLIKPSPNQKSKTLIDKYICNKSFLMRSTYIFLQLNHWWSYDLHILCRTSNLKHITQILNDNQWFKWKKNVLIS